MAHPVITADQLRSLVSTRIIGERSQKELADELGISTAYLSDFLAGAREPGHKMLTALGYERIVRYRRTG